MIQDFLSFLLGRYHNRNQAFANPSKFAYIHCYWEQVGENEIHSKSWYNYAGEDAPYREKYHRLEISDNNIIVRNYTANWEKYPCDMLFTYVDASWEGVNCGECIVKGAKLESKITLTNDNKAICYDAGIKDGKIIWGGRDLYIFEKQVTDGL